MLTISGTSYQLTLYILILKPNSQIYIYTFSGLAASCSPPLMGHYGNHNISLMELTEVKQILFFFSFILSVLNKFQVSAKQVVQLCTLLCALIKPFSGSYCWFPAECSWILNFVGVLGELFPSPTGSCSGLFKDYWL